MLGTFRSSSKANMTPLDTDDFGNCDSPKYLALEMDISAPYDS